MTAACPRRLGDPRPAVQKGGDAIAVQADVGDDAACKAPVQAALAKYGRIDTLMNHAGDTKVAPAADLDALSGDDFLRLYRNNVVSVYQMTRAAAAALKASRAGSVVNLVSRAGVSGGGTAAAPRPPMPPPRLPCTP